MIQVVLISLLLTFASTLTTFGYAFSGVATSSQMKATFSLGVLAVNDNMTFAFTSASGNPAGFTVQLLDSAATALTTQPVTFTGSFP